MKFQNILVPVDLSKHSLKSFKTALDISKKYHSKLTVLSCIEIFPAYRLYYASTTLSQQTKKQISIVKNHFNELELMAKKHDISINFKILKSYSVVKDIVNFAKSKKFDLVIIGSHGRTGFDKLLLGSVANGVSQKIKCSVLIVK